MNIFNKWIDKITPHYFFLRRCDMCTHYLSNDKVTYSYPESKWLCWKCWNRIYPITVDDKPRVNTRSELGDVVNE